MLHKNKGKNSVVSGVEKNKGKADSVDFNKLPYELIILIGTFSEPKDVGRLALTCRRLAHLLQEKKHNFYGGMTQARAMFHIKQGKNVFLHGPGGCGKSFTLDLIYDYGIQNKKNIKFCSMFGRAASNLKEGYTLCSLVGTAKLNRKDWFTDPDKGEKRLKRAGKVFNTLDILVIDEISTCGKTVLKNLNRIGQAAKRNNKFMGGIQVVISGDFYQLEPVGDKPCWKSKLFQAMNLVRIDFEYSFRQREILFSNMLQRLRTGEHTALDMEILETRLKNGNQIPASAFFIFGDNKRANTMNKACLKMIDSPSIYLYSTFHFVDKANPVNGLAQYEVMTENEMFMKIQTTYAHIHPEVLEIKNGARVLLCRNISVKDGFCNGSQGTFKIDGDKYYFVGLKNNNNNNNKRKKLLLKPMDFYVHISPRYYAIRTGYPIRLGYSGTVHSTQGITLNEVAICLDNRINRKGQAYPAMSRVTKMENLFFSAYDIHYIRTYQNEFTDKI